jgi:DnaJ-domain-containing protein 1
MSVTKDSNCSYIKLGGYITRTWVFWGEERLVPVTFAFEVRHHDATHSRGARMPRAAFERLHALQRHTPVHALTVGRRHWWWFQDTFYLTMEVFSDPQALKERLLAPHSHRGAEESSPRPSRRSSRASESAYAILGIGRHATFEEIRQAYRQRLNEYHPDKVAALGSELRRVAEEMTKKINHAYAELKTAHGE